MNTIDGPKRAAAKQITPERASTRNTIRRREQPRTEARDTPLPRTGDWNSARLDGARGRAREALDRAEARDPTFNWLRRGRGDQESGPRLPDWRRDRNPTVQPMYGVTIRPGEELRPPDVQPMYGVTIRPDDLLRPPAVQPMYGVTMRPDDDRLPTVQPMYGVTVPNIDWRRLA